LSSEGYLRDISKRGGTTGKKSGEATAGAWEAINNGQVFLRVHAGYAIHACVGEKCVYLNS